ncbi:MAG: hypothetical protein KC461_02840 [Dehalococcoidia bacterium]|nr:hypothetical protein [Dehalococcoidia bacterium]
MSLIILRRGRLREMRRYLKRRPDIPVVFLTVGLAIIANRASMPLPSHLILVCGITLAGTFLMWRSLRSAAGDERRRLVELEARGWRVGLAVAAVLLTVSILQQLLHD